MASASALYQFLQFSRVSTGGDFTHTSFQKPGGAFYIPGSRVDDFLDLYTQSVNTGDELSITEKHRHVGPVVVDFDFRRAAGDFVGTERIYDTEFVKQAVKSLARAIAEYVVIPAEGMCVYVLEKTWHPPASGVVKDGLHMVVPNIVTRPGPQYLIREMLLADETFLASLPLRLINRTEDVVDEAVIERNNWMMYGSRKPGGSPAYQATRMFKFDMSSGLDMPIDISIGRGVDKVWIETRKLVETLSIRNKSDESTIRADRADAIAAHQSNLDKNLIRRETARGVLLRDEQDADSSSTPERRTATQPDVDLARILAGLLHPLRADTYEDWMRVGWCLHNIDSLLLTHWISFSQRSPKYIEGECERAWANMRLGRLGMGTLRMWAKQDSPEQYAAIVRDTLSSVIHRSSSGTHHDVALVVHQMYRHDYVCASMRHMTWYEFRSHRWQILDMGHSLRRHISDEVFKEYVNAASSCLQRAMQLSGDTDQKAQTELSNKLLSVAGKLKCTTFKENVMKECRELFYHEKFEELLDATPDLMCFENGVFDLSTLEFRDGRPEDYISFCTNTRFIPYDPSHILAKQLARFWEQVFVCPEMRHYVLTLLASFMSGVTRDERFHVFSGCGSNGKSMVIELYEKTFGEYCCKLPVTLLTQKRVASNAATSEVSRAKGRRLGVLQEPSEDERLNIGLMKELTGGDRIIARPMYREPIEFKPMFKLVLLCNHLPAVPSDDGGTWRRIRVVAFKSKFVDRPNPNKDGEFLIDVDLSQKFESWAPHFCALLVEHYKRYLAVGRIQEPEEVLHHTREYQRNNDHFTDFVATRLVEQEAAMLGVDEAFQDFKEWVKEDRIPLSSTRKRDFKTSVEKIVGKCVIVCGSPAFRSWQLKSNVPIG